MRPSLDEYMMGFARQAALRATCPRKHVGAVIVRDGLLLSTGYNGSIRGTAHCEDVGCLMEDGHCCRTVHAEINAILQAAKNGVRIDGAALYVTASPCWPCFSAIANAGIRRVVFGEAYRATDPGPKRVVETAAAIGIELVEHAYVTVVDEKDYLSGVISRSSARPVEAK
jgi:dCMP deaminase